MLSSEGASSMWLAPAGASRLAATLLVGALLLRFSGAGAVRLRFWGAAWIALAVQVVGSMAVSFAEADRSSPVFFLGVVASCIGTYGYLLGLILGASELPEQRPLSAAARQRLISAAIGLGLLGMVGFYVAPILPAAASALRHDMSLVSRFIVCAAVAHRLGQDRPRFGTGRWLVGLSLVLQGGQAAAQLVLRITQPGAPVDGGLSGVVIAGLMGLGMIACLLDDDHQAIARASAEVRRASAIDGLTGLLNKAAFVDAADARLNRPAPMGGFGIVFLALNRLAGVNHSLGHATGDRILRASGERLRMSLRDGDEIGRVGGDEFAALIGGVGQKDDVISVAHKLEEVMRRPFEVDGRELSVTASVGVSVYPDDALDAATLLDQACTAAHRVKDRVGGRVGVYARGMNAGALERLSMEHDLRQAIDRNELVLYFQPLFRLPSATVRGFEALLRWRHPRFGLIGAEVIVSLAETTGLIHAIGRWALKSACITVEGLRKEGHEPLVLSANVSAHQLMAEDLAGHVEEALRESGLPAAHLEIEITETAAIDNVQTARDHLLRLKAMGVSIAIDDFGTGYSSLAYLRNLPLDTIKIDRSFIRDVGVDLGDGALVTTIIALAQGRDLRVVAEGVETEEQLKFLIARGCDYAQGFLLARPMPPEDLAGFLPKGALELEETVSVD
ncbi:MAG: bifunctional diguanylate cyclase/phosphodiesterase [Vicinamibacteria bacterium]|nr:bifunctional diguanylate cyclase/phosphodiesterase [Vicinamibacteria bacterium]